MMLDLLMRLPKFDPNKATQKTFVARIIERKVSKLIRHRTCEMRDHRREVCSLNERLEAENGATVELSETIALEERDRMTGRRSRSAQEDWEFAQDMAATLARLPENLRRLCELLQRGTISDAACEMGVPRTTLNDHVKKLRVIFENADLRDYL